MEKIIIIIILLFCLTGCKQEKTPIGNDLSETNLINTEKEITEIEQNQVKSRTGKYKHKPKYKIDGIEYKRNELEKPNGDVGYYLVIWADDYIQSIGWGADAEHNTWKRNKPIATSTTATTTK